MADTLGERVMKNSTHRVSFDLKSRVARGEYEVDHDAVAEALVRRMLARPRSAVLVPAEPVGGLSVRGHELESGPAANLA